MRCPLPYYRISSILSKQKGWMTGLEPATTRTTIWCSTIELHPPSDNNQIVFNERDVLCMKTVFLSIPSREKDA